MEFYAAHKKCVADTLLMPLLNVMRSTLQKRGIEVFNCGLDPRCVEVPTVPHATYHGLTQDIKSITQAAKDSHLIPQPDYYCGGGAHIHAGIDPLNNGDRAKRPAFAQRAAVYANYNPWLCWAFSAINDTGNASPVRADMLVKDRRARLIVLIKEATEAMAAHRASIVVYTEKLHKLGNWTDDYRRRGHKSQIEYQIGYLGYNRGHLGRYMKELAAGIKLAYDGITTDTAKSRCVVNRGETIEFRAFLMPHNISGHRKHIKLVLAFMAHCKKLLQQEDYTKPLLTDEDLRAMKYSAKKAGFTNMLLELKLNPADYRDEYLRMALRHRFQRANSCNSGA